MRVSRNCGLWGVLGALVVVSALALMTAGCGGSSPSSSSSSAASNPANGAAVKADPALHNLLPASILSAGQIRVASDIPYPPYEMFVGTTTQPTGFDYDLSQAFGAVLGIKVAFINTPFATIILSVQTGKYDMFMTDMLDTLAREKTLTFVDYTYDAQTLLVLKGNPNGITNLDSLAGKTVACEIGTSAQLLLQALNKRFKSAGKEQMTVLSVPNQPAALLALKSGRAVAAMAGNATNAYTAKTTNNGATFENLQDPAAPLGYEPQPVGIGIRKNNAELVTAVQKALQELINNGVYAALCKKYGGLPPVKSAQINGAASQSPSPSATP